MKKFTGFTLIELMITVAIIGILAAIAFPSYTSYVLKSHRSAAITALMELASKEARYYSTNNAYVKSLTTLGYAADPMPVTSSTTKYYNLSVTGVTADGFTLQAVPVGNQVNDTCGTYTYNDLGVKGVSAGTVKECWKQ